MALKTNLQSLVPSSERLKKQIKLLSGGYSLKPEIQDGRITVYPWDTEISEWVVGEADNNSHNFAACVVQKLTRLPSKVMDRFVVSELLSVMLIARSLTSEGVLEYRATCPHCKQLQSLTKLAVGEMRALGEKAPDYSGTDEFSLPVSKDILKFRPLLVADLDVVATKRPSGISETGANTALCIVEVNGGKPDNPKELFDYYLALPPADVDFLREKVTELSPALDTVIPHVCDSKKCEKEFKWNLGLNYDFFLSRLHG